MTLVETFRHTIGSLALPHGSAVVAVSGGPDSVALLDLLSQSKDIHGLELVIGHADHGIHPESGRVAEQVAALGVRYGLPVEIGRLGLGAKASETAARAARYAWLEELRARRGAGVIFTAHHADDQVETVLMRVLAGSGPAGLAGMAVINGTLVRPLLRVSRAVLLRHLAELGLTAWLDPSNRDHRHLRSWVRTGLLPDLRKQLPGVDANIRRLSGQAARNRSAWNTVLELLPGLDLSVESDGISVAAPTLGGYDSRLAEAVVQAVSRRAGCQVGPGRIGRVLALVRAGKSGAWVPLGGEWVAEVSFGRLRISRKEASRHTEPCRVEGRRGKGTWGRWAFRWEPGVVPNEQPRTAMSAWFSFDELTVRGWLPGEKLRPLGGNGRRLIVRCFQEVRVPRGKRDTWPVLARNDEVIWIPGVCRSDALLPAKGTEALRIDAEYA